MQAPGAVRRSPDLEALFSEPRNARAAAPLVDDDVARKPIDQSVGAPSLPAVVGAEYVVEHHHADAFAAQEVPALDLEIQVPPTFPEKYRSSLIRSAELCAVKKHFEQPPTFEITTKEVEMA